MVGAARGLDGDADATGAVQTEDRAAPYPAGASGWHSTVVTVT
ncbi:hypothetical protein ACIRVF_03945 [Kitasatospora sp. NPDC101157]